MSMRSFTELFNEFIVTIRVSEPAKSILKSVRRGPHVRYDKSMWPRIQLKHKV